MKIGKKVFIIKDTLQNKKIMRVAFEYLYDDNGLSHYISYKSIDDVNCSRTLIRNKDKKDLLPDDPRFRFYSNWVGRCYEVVPFTSLSVLLWEI